MVKNADDDFDKLYEKFNLSRKYDHPTNVTESNSFFDGGDARYPPDWRYSTSYPKGGRKGAIYEYQDGKCARCKEEFPSENEFYLHHYRPLGKGGKHSLNNLLGLCESCHKLIHPNVDDLDGDWREAQLFPSPTADRRVATIRKPVTDEEKRKYLPELKLLEEKSEEGDNLFSNSEATLSVSPADAIRAAKDFEQLMRDIGIAFDTTFTIVVSSGDSTIENVKVVGFAKIKKFDTTISIDKKTDNQGKVKLSIPKRTELKLGIKKDGYQSRHINEIVTETSTYNINLSSKDSASVHSTSSPGANQSPNSSSRRGVFKWGLLGIIGIGGIGLLTDSSSPSENNDTSASDEPDKQSTTTTRKEPTFAPSAVANIGDGIKIETLSHDGEGFITGLETGLVSKISGSGKIQWKVDLKSRLHDIYIYGDKIYAGAGNSIFGIQNGKIVWENRFEEQNIESGIQIAADSELLASIFKTSEGTKMHVFNRETKKTIQTFNPDRSIRYPRFANGNLLYLNEYKFGTIKLDLDTEALEFKTSERLNKAVYLSDITVSGERAYFTRQINFGGDYEVTAKYGSYMKVYHIPTMTNIWSSSVYSEGTDDPKRNRIAVPKIGNGRVCYSDGGQTICFDNSGVELWRSGVTSSAPPVITDDQVLLGGDRESGFGVSVHELDTGKKITTSYAIQSRPKVASQYQGGIAIGTEAGKLYLY